VYNFRTILNTCSRMFRDEAYYLSRRFRNLADRVISDRQIMFRTNGQIRCVSLDIYAQMGIVLVLIGGLAWVGYSAYVQIEQDRLVASKDREIGSLRLAYGNLKGDLNRSETRFHSIARTLETKHAYLMALVDRKTGLAKLNRQQKAVPELKDQDLARARISDSRRALLTQLGQLELVLKGLGRRNQEFVENTSDSTILVSVAKQVRLGRERKRLIARVETLEGRLLALGRSQKLALTSIAEQTVDEFYKVKKLISGTGIDIDNLLAQSASPSATAQGGPFIAAGSEGIARRSVPESIGIMNDQINRWDDLRKLIQIIPLATPSDHYYLASGYGKRRDPVNGRWAMHHGVDMAGVYRSQVRSTAPGVVVSVGWNGNYGRMIEIDHGQGIRTRYGHLRRILVRRGQKVGFREKIGEMGNSGRSTGTHLHYEVTVNGKTRDPLKFIEAGKYVLKGL
jgi:murein DD-endopeptidase MepM/ murein hydrolase activator NlpD